MEGYLAGYANGLVTLCTPEGRYIKCKDTLLCSADRQYLESRRSPREKICCRWRGVHVDGEDVYHHDLIIKGNGRTGKLTATDTISLGLSSAQVARGKSLKNDNLMYPFSMIVEQEYEVTLEGVKLSLIPGPGKPRRIFEAPGYQERNWMAPKSFNEEALQWLNEQSTEADQ